MGQYYELINFTRKVKVSVGKFYGDFDYYVKLLGWDKNDEVTAYGDYDDIIHMNPKAPDNIKEMDCEGVWTMCQFAAKKLNMDPMDFYVEFLHDGCIDEDEFTTISMSELIATEKEKMQSQVN